MPEEKIIYTISKIETLQRDELTEQEQLEALSPDLIKVNTCKNMNLENKVEDLFWKIKEECEEMSVPLLGKMNIIDLMVFLYPEYKPQF